MNDLTNRKLLKAKRRNRDGTNVIGNVCRSRSTPFCSQISSDNKNKYNDSHNDSFTVSSQRFSANDRLKKYRNCLETRKNEIVKVHQVFNPTPTNPNCKTATKRILAQEHNVNNHTNNNEICNKKRKVVENTRSDKSDKYVAKECNTAKEDSNMDWSPINEDEVVLNIQKLRESCEESSSVTSILNSCNAVIDKCSSSEMEPKTKLLYVVVDTNIFISHLKTIEEMLSGQFGCDYVIYIPWIVIQELDYFKDGRSGSSPMIKTAKRAIKFINDNLLKKHTRLKGQTVKEALSQKGSSSNADDNIVFCCIQLMQASNTVILLSNDVNLRNKALINNIAAFGPKDIITKIKGFNENKKNQQRIYEINLLLSNMCTEIILSEMREAYGSVLYKLITGPPWDLKQCLIYLKRFWSPVFSIVITQRQCLKVIEDLLTFIQISNDLTTEKNMEEFVKLCLSLCVYFKNCLIRHRESVVLCISNIQRILN